jgi:hypothetical protein
MNDELVSKPGISSEEAGVIASRNAGMIVLGSMVVFYLVYRLLIK